MMAIHTADVELSIDILGDLTPGVVTIDYYVAPTDKVSGDVSLDGFEAVICGVSLSIDGTMTPVPGWLVTSVYENTALYEFLLRDWNVHYAEEDILEMVEA